MAQNNSFSFGFAVHTTNESKSHSQSASPNKRQSKKQSPVKRRAGQNADTDAGVPEEDPTANNVQFSSQSVSKLLDSDHLNAAAANTIHDLQCATGIFVLQAYLEFPRLRRVLGIEANKEFFHLAQQNAVNLTKAGYQGRKFFIVDNIPGVKTIIGEYANEATENAKSFSKGEVVTCLQSLKRNNIDKREDYRGVVSSVKKGGLVYDITMSATKKVIQNVKREHVFKPGSERTLELARCNLFQRKDGFRSEIIMLPFFISNDASYRSLLCQALTHSPFNSRVLAYEMLEDWDQFETREHRETLKRIDVNAYDNDRFETNLSKFYKVYLYKHCISRFLATPLAKLQQVGALQVGNYVRVRDDASQTWITSKIEAIAPANKSIRVSRYMWEAPFEEEVQLDSQKIHLLEFDYKVGDIVHCYCTKQVVENRDNKWSLYRCSVIGINPDGTYEIEFEDGERYRQQLSVWMFRPPRFEFEEGNMLIADRYDDSKYNEGNDTALPPPPQNYCVIRHHNPDGTYRVEFLGHPLPFHDMFCEAWLRRMSDAEKARVLPVLPLTLELDYLGAELWRSNMVSHFFKRCGFGQEVCAVFNEKNVNGPFLLNMTFDVLTQDLGLSEAVAMQVYSYITSLRREARYRYVDNSAVLAVIEANIESYMAKQEELKDVEYQATKRLNEMKSKQKLTQSDAKNQRDYEIKIKCIQMSRSGVSKKEISKKLNKPMNWVNKFYKKSANEVQRPVTSNSEIDSAQENLNRVLSQIRDNQAKLISEKERLRLYSLQ